MSAPHSQKNKTAFYFGFWIIGLMIPAVLVYLWDSAPRYRALRALREQGVDVSPTSVFHGIAEGNVERLRLLSVAGAPFQQTDGAGRPPAVAAVTAAKEGPNDVLKFLAQLKQINLDQRDAQGFSALSHAIARNDGDAIRTLVERVKDPNVSIPPRPGATASSGPELALIKATKERDGALLGCLLAHPEVNVDIQDEKGMTPLHHAAQLDVAEPALALFRGAKRPSPALKDAAGHTPLYYALHTDKSPETRGELVGAFLENGGQPPAEEWVGLMFLCVDRNDEFTLRQFLTHGADANAKDPATHHTLLEQAVDRGSFGCVLELLNAGADPTRSFQQAIACGAAETAELLTSRGHFQGATPASLAAPLEQAILGGNPACVDLTLRLGADPNQASSLGQRALTLAIASKNGDTVRHLLAKGAEVEYELASPVSPGFLAIGGPDIYTSGFLKNDRGMTPLFLASLLSRADIVEALIEKGAKTNFHTQGRRRYPVEVAAARGNVAIQQMVLGKKAGDQTRRIVISLSKQQATLFQNGQAALTTSVSTGKKGYRTKSGSFVITNKYREWTSTLYHSSMPFFMRLSCDAFGLHSGYVPGYPASHGCIRVPYSRARQLFGIMQVGDQVEIVP